ncbi:damage-inducible protein CinA [Ectothiorhodospira shaposhnikovii]|uniref:CinA family protein n=1 Tax=Ectothiorhodospira shaposhnikovii TaxID=1054 RepID=UPI001908C2D1|nr:CinA family protein [Ectothiorhodospira shaposhnikovii]MBK1674315.1 damage-inducible protein CinA [Ectothiorhodospira shaposhnikovii]
MSLPSDDELVNIARLLGEQLCSHGERLVLAESCTGGWIAKVITDLPGSSVWFDRGFVTYSNESKVQQLGVDPDLIDRYGAVSQETVAAMAEGALVRSQAHLSIAASGIAGPGGGSTEKPSGTVWLAWARLDQVTQTRCFHFPGERETVRRQAVAHALQGAITP